MTHNGKQSYDKRRENRLKELGLNVLRFNGYDVLNNITEALELVLTRIDEIENKTSPYPPSKGELDFAPK